MADTQFCISARKGFIAAETVAAQNLDLLGTISTTSSQIFLRDPTKDPRNQGNPCCRRTGSSQTGQSRNLSSDSHNTRSGEWKGEIYTATGHIRAIHKATHPIDPRQTVFALYLYINNHRTVVEKEVAEDFNPDLKNFDATGLQKGHLSVGRTGSSSWQDGEARERLRAIWHAASLYISGLARVKDIKGEMRLKEGVFLTKTARQREIWAFLIKEGIEPLDDDLGKPE